MSCGHNFPDDNTPIVSKILFQTMTCNQFLFKAIIFVAIFFSSLVVAKTGELFNKQQGWLAGVLVFLSTAWVNYHIQVEDDLLAYPLLFLANYFFLRGLMANRNYYKGFGVLLAILIGLFVWKGAFLYLVVYSFFFVPALIIVFAFLLFINSGALHQIFLPSDSVMENVSALKALELGFGYFGFGHGLGMLGAWVFSRRIFFLGLAFFVASLFNIKWTIHAAPFLGIGLMLLFVKFLEKQPKDYVKPVSRFKWWVSFDEWVFKNPEKALVLLVFLVILVTRIIFFVGADTLYAPFPAQIEAIDFLIQKASGGQVFNDWSYGYLILQAGGKTLNFGGGGGDRFVHLEEKGYYLTENPEGLPCDLVSVWEKKGFWGSDLKIYKC